MKISKKFNHVQIPPIDYNLFKGVLCIFIIIGHCQEAIPNGIIQIIYWFHMPCFFMLSGWFAVERLDNYKIWLLKKIKRLFFPQVIWFVILTGLQGRLDIELCWSFLKGARNIGGVYWYVPVFFVDLVLFELVKNICKRSLIKMNGVFLVAYLLVIFIQYNIWEKIELDEVSFSVGITLLCLIYMYIGYRYRLLHNRKTLVPQTVLLSTVLIIILTITLYKLGIFKFNMDLASMKAGSVGMNLIIPSSFMICVIFGEDLLLRHTRGVNVRILRGIRKLGANSLFVMYFHKYILNDVVEVLLGSGGYMWVVNVIITIALLGLILLLFNKFPAQIVRLMGGNNTMKGEG